MKRLHDAEEVKRYLQHPAIWDAICVGVDFDDYQPDMAPDFHYLVTAPESMFCLHPFGLSDYIWQIHAHVHPDYRHNAKDACLAAMRYAFDELTALRLTALIPDVFPRIRGFAKKCGFSDHEYLSDCYLLKDGGLAGQWLMGISYREFNSRF